MHRPDAAEDSDLDEKEEETVGENIKEAEERVKSDQNEKRERIIEKQEKERAEKLEQERLMREVMMKQFGISEKKVEEMMDQSRSRSNRTDRVDSESSERDPFYQGLNSSKDAPDWRTFMGRTIQGNKEKWEQRREGRIDSMHNSSPKHGVDGKTEGKFFVNYILVIVCSSVILLSLEYKYRDLDK